MTPPTSGRRAFAASILAPALIVALGATLRLLRLSGFSVPGWSVYALDFYLQRDNIVLRPIGYWDRKDLPSVEQEAAKLSPSGALWLAFGSPDEAGFLRRNLQEFMILEEAAQFERMTLERYAPGPSRRRD